MRLIAVLILMCLLVGCSKRVDVELSSATLPGNYMGTYEKGQTEIFVFKPDGTFSQRLSSSSGVLYTNDGQWKIDQENIVLNNVYLAVDVWNLNNGKPSKVDFYRAYWDRHTPSIVFSDDGHFWVDKQPAK